MKNKFITGIVVQARVTSTRLPRKVFADIEGKPMLWHVIERLKKCKTADKIIVAIPDTKENDILEDFCKDQKIDYFRGSENNVLSRYYYAAQKINLDVVVRVTSDCPLIDPEIVDEIIKKHLSSGSDYTANFLERTFPRGLDAEVFGFNILEKAFKEAEKDYEKEHVTPYIYQHPEVFKLKNFAAEGKLKKPEMRLVVDTKEDLQLAREVYKNLYKPNKIFYAKEAIDFLEKNKELLNINAKVNQKKLGE